MIPLSRFYPQGEHISVLARQIREGRLTHAMLISGEKGMGKWTLARAIAASLLCQGDQGPEMPCGRCRACAQMEALSHPDLTVLRKGEPLVPTETKKVIPVSDAQEMLRRISLRGYEGNRRVVIIRHAEDLYPSAADKMLKTLEEPPEGIFFLLTAVRPESLKPTILSRCRPLKLHPWPEREILRALEENGYTGDRAREAAGEAGGSIGRALEIAGDGKYWEFASAVMRDFFCCPRRGDILSVSNRWKDRKAEAENAFSVMDRFIDRIIRKGMGLPVVESSVSQIPEKWVRFAERADAEDFVRLTEAVSLARQRVQNNVPFQAVTEQLILSFMEAVET